MAEWNVPILLMFLVNGLCVCRCLPSFLHHDAKHVETVYLTAEEHLPSAVVKRASSHLPRNLNFRFHYQNRPIRLRLKRSNHDDQDLPVFTLRNGLPTRQRMEKDLNIGFYHDTDHGASFQVTAHHQPPSQPYHLEGTLFINGIEYLLSPEHRMLSVNGSEIAHSMKRLTESLPFGQDVIDERDPYAQFSARQREFQRHIERLQRNVNPWFSHNSSRAWRKKRQSQRGGVDTHYIEVSMIADYAVWLRFMEYANNDEDKSFQELQLYYKYLATMMDVRYESVTKIDPNLVIRIRPVSLIVTNFRKEAIWTEPNRRGRNFVHAVNSLYALRNWVRRGVGVPEADHTMLFTGYDLQGSNSDSSTIGVAFIGTACTFNSVSLIEEYFTGTSGAVSAHELGHSLNAEHDGEYRRCSDVTSNVMSTNAVFPSRPSTISNPWIFSDCSVDAFGAFLEGSNCTRNEPKLNILPSVTRETTFEADEQCRLVMGQGSYFCRSVQARRGFSSMCRHLYCYLPDDPGYCGSVIAAEFTVCGNGKWCNQGKCVRHPEAPIVSDSCPQGDEPGYECTADKCQEAKVKSIFCCQFCQALVATTKAPDNLEKLIIGATSSTSLESSSVKLSTDSYSTVRTSMVTTLKPLISSMKSTTNSISKSSTGGQVALGTTSPAPKSTLTSLSTKSNSLRITGITPPSPSPAQRSPSALSTSSIPSSTNTSITAAIQTTKSQEIVTTRSETTQSPSTSSRTTTTAAPAKETTPIYVPCASIQCLCQRCFYCYLNLCPLFLPGGLYYSPGR